MEMFVIQLNYGGFLTSDYEFETGMLGYKNVNDYVSYNIVQSGFCVTNKFQHLLNIQKGYSR